METRTGAGTPVDAALRTFASALDGLVVALKEGGLDHLDDAELLEFLRALEQERNRISVVDHLALAAAEQRDLAGRYGQGRLTRLLTAVLRISPAEAARRVRAADQLGTRTSVLGEALPAQRPVLAAAQREGLVTPDQVDLVVRGLIGVDRAGFDPADIVAGEVTLTELATTFGPRDLRVCVDRWVELLDPDGSVPDERLAEDRRWFELRAQRDGSWRGELRLTGPVGAKLRAVLDPLARPRVEAPSSEGRAAEPDPRAHGQRLHDALEEVCDRLLRAGDVPGFGGLPATVVVTIDEDSLRSRTGTGTTTSGQTLSVAQVLELADQAEIIPTVLNRSGALLTCGRTRRIANADQTLALVARDRGCSFPGCDRPPEWCERHHIRAWIDGGRTDLDNLTLLCRYHHHNFAGRGWACRLNGDGLPEWVPPRFVDREQRPLVNARILAALSRYDTTRDADRSAPRATSRCCRAGPGAR